MKKMLGFVVATFLSVVGYGQCTFDGGGITPTADSDWFNPANWTGIGCEGANALTDADNNLPTASDAVTIAGQTVTITTSGALASNLTIQDNDLGTDGILTISSGDLTVSGDITLNDNLVGSENGTLTISGGDVTINGGGVLEIETGGEFNISAGNLILTTATNAINVTGSGSWNSTGGTVHFSRIGDDTQEIDVDVDYPNIEIDGGQVVSVTNTITNVENLTISSGELLISGGNGLSGSGGNTIAMSSGTDLRIQGDADFPLNYSGVLDANSTVTFEKNNTETMSSPSNITFGNVVFNSTGATLTFTGVNNVIGSLLDINNGIIILEGSNWDGDGTGTMDVANATTIQYNGNVNFPGNYSTYTFGASSNTIFNGGNQNVSRVGSDIDFGNLSIQGTNTKTLLDAIGVKGLLDIQSGKFATGSNTVEGWSSSDEIRVRNGATLDVGSIQFPTNFNTVDLQIGSIVEFTSNGLQIINDDIGDDHVNFYNLYLQGSGTKQLTSGISIQNGGTLDIGGLSDVGGVTFDTDANDISLTTSLILDLDAGNTIETSAGDLFDATLITETLHATSTFLYNGTSQAIEDLTYGNLTIDQSGTKILDASISLTGNLTISNSATLDINALTVDGQSNGKNLILNYGTKLSLSGVNNFPVNFDGGYVFNNNSTVNYDLNGAQTISIHDYENLDLTGGGTKTIQAGTTGVKGILDVEDGAMVVTSLSGGQFLRLISIGDAAGETAEIADLTGEGGTGILSGDGFICERDMDLTGPDVVGWNDWCSPIVGFRLASWYYKGWPMTGVGGIRGSDYPSNPFCSVLTYNSSALSTPYFVFTNDGVTDKNDGWVRAPNITDGWSVGTGFRLYTGARDRELEDIGTPGQGQVVVNLGYESIGNSDEEGWNLVGNPYMCTIDFNNLTRTGSVSNAMWLYSNSDKTYYTHNGSTDVGTEPFGVLNGSTSLIPSHKAFWVKTSAASQTLTFDENDKTTGGTAYIKSNTANAKMRVQIQNLYNGYLSAAVVLPFEGATRDYEQFDTEIFKSNTSTAPNLYFLSNDNKQLSINAVPKETSTVPLVIEPGISGDFELRFYDYNDMPTGYCMWLEDKETNNWIDIRETQTLNLNLIDTVDYSKRFLVHINPILNVELSANTTCFGTNDGQVLVKNLADSELGLALYNELGKEVANELVNKEKIIGDLAPGIYTVREAGTSIGCPAAHSTVEVTEPQQVIANFEASALEIDLATDNNELLFTSTSEGESEHIWYFSDDGSFSYEEEVYHTFTETGVFDVTLLAHNGNYDCAEVAVKQVTVNSTVGIEEESAVDNSVQAFVANNEIMLTMAFESTTTVNASLYDIAGKEINKWRFRNVSNLQKKLELPETKGLYILNVTYDNTSRSFSLVK